MEFFKELIRTRLEDIVEERQPLSHLLKGRPALDRIRAARKAPGPRAKLKAKL